jgi:uncharacterized repeat protein (TIGR04138 family)
MSHETHPIVRLLRKDPRYSIEAYQFVREALSYAQDVLNMGSRSDQLGDELGEELGEELDEESELEEEFDPTTEVERHLTGQQLCEAIRQYALDQYGYMSKVVLNRWGVRETGDFGNIVYNLIDVKLMKKSEDDRREDFNDVYDFDEAFQQQFQITPPKV